MKKNQEEKIESIRISAIGILDLTLHLTLRESDLDKYSIDTNEINSIEDIGHLLYQEDNNEVPQKELIDLITLSSDNFLINTLLWINRAYKQKTFIELITLNEMIFSQKRNFIKKLLKTVTEKNFIFIVENPLQDIHPKISFVFKILNDDNEKVLEEKKFPLFERNCIIMNQPDDSTNFFSYLSYNFNCDFFFADFGELLRLRNGSMPDVSSLYTILCQKFSHLKFITNFSSGLLNKSSSLDVLDSIKKVVSFSDLLFFEKEEMKKFYSIFNEVYSQDWNRNKLAILSDKDKKRKNIPRVSVVIDKMENVSVISQVGVNMKEEYNNEFTFSFIKDNAKNNMNDKQEYQKLIQKKYPVFKSIFVGSFLSRALYGKKFSTCFTAGNLSIKNMLDVIRFNIDYITNLKYYQVVVPTVNKKETKNIRMQELLKIKENNFILDGITTSLKKKRIEYNSLCDNNCQSFFLSQKNKMFLTKAGFINKKGVVLKDPGFLNVPKKEHNRMKFRNGYFTKDNFFFDKRRGGSKQPYLTCTSKFSKGNSHGFIKKSILPPLHAKTSQGFWGNNKETLADKEQFSERTENNNKNNYKLEEDDNNESEDNEQ